LQVATITFAPSVPRGDPKSAKGLHILHAAEDVFISDGAAGFGLRRVAAEAGLKLATIQYYYPTVEIMLQATVKSLMASYNEDILVIINGPQPAEKRLALVVHYIIDIIQDARTCRVMFECLALAQRDANARNEVTREYCRYRSSIEALISQINPALPREIVVARASLTICQLDGLALIGFPGGPGAPDWFLLAEELLSSLTRLIKS